MRRPILLIAGVLMAVAASACGPKDVIPTSPTHPASPGEDKAAIAANEQSAYQAARPVFEKYCSDCHSSGGKKATPEKLDHFNMDTYPFGGHHATMIGETVREVLGLTGKEPTMPKSEPGAVKGEELDLVAAWSKAFDASHKAGLHHHHEEDGGDDHDHDHDHGDHDHAHGGH